MDIPPVHFYPGYVQPYIERDVRTLKNISNLGLFQLFLKMCAPGRQSHMSFMGEIIASVEQKLMSSPGTVWTNLIFNF